LSVSVNNRQRRLRVSTPRLGAVARRALALLKRPDRELHVTVVNDREIGQLHARYLGVRGPTDVLAFDIDGPAPSRLLGEVIISADTAARQAARLDVSLALELDLLLVHGLLHLVGYDDHEPRAARRMHERAHEILSRVRRRPPPDRLFIGLLDRSASARLVRGEPSRRMPGSMSRSRTAERSRSGR
jgi:probable rRNA maturation factor